MRKRYMPFRSGKKHFKTFVVKCVCFILGRGLQAASRVDADVRREIREWIPEGFTILFKVWPEGPRLGLESRGGMLRFRGTSLDDADLVIYFKNIDSAFMMFTAQMGVPQAFAEHRIFVKGDISVSMSLIRCLNIVETHLFPPIIYRRILRRPPSMGLKKQFCRLYIYLVGIPIGI